MSADLRADLQAEIETARERPQEEGHTAAIRQIADIVGISEERAAGVVAAIEAETMLVRQRLLRRFAEGWIEGQRRAYQNRKDH